MASPLTTQILQRLNTVYVDYDPVQLDAIASKIVDRALRTKQLLIDQKTGQDDSAHSPEKWDEASCMLITYADSLSSDDASPLASLARFYHQHLSSVIDTVHILPFFPSGGDDGFSVIDYKTVEPQFGCWSDINALASSARIMADLVINHGSAQSTWFQKFLDSQAPEKNYFMNVDDQFDTSQVVRPRAHPLLRTVETADGPKQIWCTFSEDQVDFDFGNPELLLEFIDIILFYLEHGVKLLRLDAVGFLYKKSGTKCLNLPETHAIIRLLRHITDLIADDVVVVTETNLPNQENLSYFGNSNEAHWIYNFPLPPLLVYTLLFADSTALRRWSMSMPPSLHGTAYLNFISSHDGIGMRPAEGILTDTQTSQMVDRLQSNGSLFSWRAVAGQEKKVYEANITLFSALEKTDSDPEGALSIERYLAAYTLMFGLEGVPAIYINSLFGAENDLKGAEESQMNRRINREKWNEAALSSRLQDLTQREGMIFSKLRSLLNLRSRQSAFHPNATQFTLQVETSFFGVWRQSQDRRQSIFAVTNLTTEPQDLDRQLINLIDTEDWVDLISGDAIPLEASHITFAPYQTVWITNRPN